VSTDSERERGYIGLFNVASSKYGMNEEVDSAIITKLIAMLREDKTTDWVARILGVLGPSARPAIPILLEYVAGGGLFPGRSQFCFRYFPDCAEKLGSHIAASK
jgi:hypothetical protein